MGIPKSQTGKLMLETMGFPGGSGRKESASNGGDPGSIPGTEIFPAVRNDNSLQYSCLENSMDTGAWQAMLSQT